MNMWTYLRCTSIALCLIVIAATLPARGQSTFTVFDVDSTAYPVIRAKMLAVGDQGRTLSGLPPAGVVVQENGIPRNVTGIECPPAQMLPRLSCVLLFDITGSMDGLGIDLSKYGASVFAQRLAFGNSECAIVTRVINQDLTTNQVRLLASISALVCDGGFSFDGGFVNNPEGAIPVAASGKHRRIVLFFTDGDDHANDTAIVAAAKRADVSVFVLNVGGAAPRFLRNIATQTGGRVVNWIWTKDDMRAAILSILDEVQGEGACTLTWHSGPDCSRERTVDVSIPALGMSARGAYIAPIPNAPTVVVQPASVLFGPVAPGGYRDTTIALTALNGPVTVQSIAGSTSALQILSGGAPPAFTLMPGDTRRVTMRYAAADSGYAFSQLAIKSDACEPVYIFASAGYPGVPPRRPTFRVTVPNGGERLAVGSAAVVAWEGALPTTPVHIEYSTDAGRTWNSVADDATGFRFSWTVPNTPSERCLLRASPKPPDTLWAFAAVRAFPGTLGMTGFLPDGRLAMIEDGYDGLDAKQHWVTVDPMVRLVDRYTGAALGRFDSVRLEFVGFSSDGRGVMSYDGSVLLARDFAGGAAYQQWGAASAAAFDPVFTRYAVNDSSSATWKLHVFDLNTGTQLATFSNAQVNSDYRVQYFSRDGSYLLFWDQYRGVLSVGDVRTSSEAMRLIQSGSAFFFPRGSQFLTFRPFDSLADGGFTHLLWDSIDVWDAANSAHMAQWSMAPEVAAKHIPNDRPDLMYVTPDGSRLITCHIDEHLSPDPPYVQQYQTLIAVWDVMNGKLLKTLFLPKKILNGGISPDGRLFAFGCLNDSVVRVWDLYAAPLEQDMSDSLWAIDVPRSVVPDLDFGKVAVGGTKDSTVAAYVRNSGTVRLDVQSMRVANDANNEFRILGDNLPFSLMPDEVRAAWFEFSPKNTGIRSASVELSTPFKTISQSIHGEGIIPQLEASPAEIDFGALAIGGARDTIVNMVVRNIGAAPLNVTAVRQGGPDAVQFITIAGDGSFTLQPGEGRSVTLRFAPRYIGRTSGQLAFDFDGIGSPSRVVLLGQGIGGTVSVPDTSGRPGELLGLPLVLSGPRTYIAQAGSAGFKATLRFNARLLIPNGPLEHDSLSLPMRTVTVRGSWDGSSDTLLRVPLMVALGDTDITNIDLLSFEWLGDGGIPTAADVETGDGVFHLTGICTTGTQRLLEASGSGVALKPAKPNPANASVRVEFSTIESGLTTLRMADGLGRHVATLVSGSIGIGEHGVNVDVSTLPAGEYFLILATPTDTRVGRIVVEH